MCVYDLKPGQAGVVDNISGDDKLVKRLMALGCIEGTEVTLKRVAPLGDPLIISLRGFNIAIRKNDAKNILLKK
ncbi:ferrous iron transport protein A [Clostridium sp. C8-1-8]|uniref:FeoA family protein n=1 Tax=Clostridium sp. C8-1-8 TaxID=2698831 RepID=UPI00136F143E|nr:ferrous iron transport protein A [Clostridium sp. C8-1-8]